MLIKRVVGIFIIMTIFWACEDENSRLGDAYFNNGDYEKAISAYSEYLSLKPNNIKTLYNRGRAYEELGMYDKALKDFNQVLVNDLDHIQTHLSIGTDHFRNKRYKDAIYQSELVLAKNPQNSHAYLLRARSNQMEGKLKDAMTGYNP